MKKRKSYGYWQDKENCKIEASKFKTISLFAINCRQGYQVARKNNWLDEICQHMERMGNRYNKCIYLCVFLDKHLYVGLTYNFSERKSAHLNLNGKKLSSVSKHMLKTGLVPKIIRLTNYVEKNIAIELEKKYLNKYRNKGFIILNKIKTGGIGGSLIKWDKESCRNEALRYKFRNEFRVNSSGAYDSAHRNGWLNEITEHMLIYRKYEGYWIKERCIDAARKCKTKTEFFKRFSGAYDSAHRNNWLMDIYQITGL